MGYATLTQSFEAALRREIPKILGPLWSEIEIHIEPNYLNATKFYAFKGKLSGKAVSMKIELDEAYLVRNENPYQVIADQIFEAAKELSYTERPAARYIKA